MPDKYVEYSDEIPIQERSTMRSGLPKSLKIKDIAELAYPDSQTKQEHTQKVIIELCKSGSLEYYGDINGWNYREGTPNPYPKIINPSYTLPLFDWSAHNYEGVNNCV